MKTLKFGTLVCAVLAADQRYSPEQAELLPAHGKDVLGADHLCFMVHEVVEACDLRAFEKAEEEAGGQRRYDPRMMRKIWL